MVTTELFIQNYFILMTNYYWYSPQMDKQSGHSVFDGPDGDPIKITTITQENRPGSLFGDEKLIHKGLVLKFLKSNFIWTPPSDEINY